MSRSAARRLLDTGERAVLVECADVTEALGLAAALRADPIAAVTEVVPGARTVLVRLARPLTTSERGELATRPPRPTGSGDEDPVTIAVDYDGEDLAEVARRLGTSAAEVVARHTGQLWTVGFCGFSPGFGYLYGEHDDLRVPRRAEPRTRVPTGAVALADRWTGVYPRPGPGGWQLIGRTSTPVWDLARKPPALFRPGVRVRFRAGEAP